MQNADEIVNILHLKLDMTGLQAVALSPVS